MERPGEGSFGAGCSQVWKRCGRAGAVPRSPRGCPVLAQRKPWKQVCVPQSPPGDHGEPPDGLVFTTKRLIFSLFKPTYKFYLTLEAARTQNVFPFWLYVFLF